MPDNFSQLTSSLDAPGLHAAAVTPSDSVALTTDARALFIGTGGNIVIVTSGGETVTFTGVLSGSILPVRTHRVNSTSTTASNIVALW